MLHYFNIEIAEDVGLQAAVLLQNFYFWICANKKAGRNEVEGRTWTFWTQAGLSEQLPYLSRQQIRTAIKRLKVKGYLSTGCFNKKGLDRTVWYSVTDKAVEILEKPENTDVSPIGSNQPNHWLKSTKALVGINQSIGWNQPSNTIYITKMYNTDIEKKQTKKRYAEFVSLTEGEYQTLVDKFGEQSVNRMIEILDNYKGSKGKKYKSDYRAILSWVVKRYEEEQPRKNVVVDVAGQAKNIIGGGVVDRCNSGCYRSDDGSIRTTAESG